MTKTSRIRIIAGKWRGRWITFPEVSSLRPTPNRVRETLFNWLMHDITGARCLDAFSGSGALAFEALSRGAREVFAFDIHPEVIQALQSNKEKLQAEGLQIIPQNFKNFANALDDQPIDLVFLDPPFHQNLIPEALTHIKNTYKLSSRHKIYVEVEKSFDLRSVPYAIQVLKEQIAGEVKYGLWQL